MRIAKLSPAFLLFLVTGYGEKGVPLLDSRCYSARNP